MAVRIERVPEYLKRSRLPGEKVVLVDRLWPRGIKKDVLDIDQWMKEIGPSHALRQWFGHDPSKWERFRSKYQAELNADTEKQQLLAKLRRLANSHDLTVIFNARDPLHNQARVIQELLEQPDV